MKKSSFLTVLLMFAVCTCLQAAQIGSWKVYLSYHNATKNVAAGKTIYTVANGDLYSYNTEDTEVRTYDNLGLLNDVDIVDIGYSQEAKKIILIYSNCNIDLLDADDNVQNLSALKEKSLSGKEISNMCIYGSTAYLSTGFGMIEVDMKEGVFRNTYRLGLDATSIAVNDNNIYLGTTTGLYVCSKADNMQLQANWKKYQESTDWSKLLFYKDNLLGVRNDSLFVIDTQHTNTITRINGSKVSFIRETNDMLFWGDAKNVCYGSDVNSFTTIKEDNTWSDVTYLGGTYWVSDQYKGLQGYKITNNQMQVAVSSIIPNSPIRNLAYKLNWADNRLLVAGGINTVLGREFFKEPTAMYVEDDQWTNFEEMTEIPEIYKNITLANTTDVVQDPKDPTHHYASLHRNGLCEYRNGKFVKLHNSDNSPLRSILSMSKYYMNYVSCAGLKYDADGNLWMLCSLTDTIVRVLRPDGKWNALFYEPIKMASLCDNIVVNNKGMVFLTSRRLDMRGVFCIDTNGTLENNKDDKCILLQQIINQDETVYDPVEFYGICEDLDGKIWFGTTLGLFVIDEPEKVFDKTFRVTQVKVNRNDGSGLADYLLSGLPVTCIAVDGANRKWVGTQNNGVFLISADGQETIHHFTAADSPLLSDAIQDIAVNAITGEVAIGTEKGLCSYMSDAIGAAEELVKDNVLVYPNPVRSDYTGPISITGMTMDAEVKILSSSGQLVWSGVSSGGLVTWNGCNMNGKRVSSGVYHVVANNNAGNKAIVTRIVVIK
ncbi:MAG: regulator [Bacteroidaceae bacterium]|nr:regulator [Bacteroidaceae bacterium]